MGGPPPPFIRIDALVRRLVTRVLPFRPRAASDHATDQHQFMIFAAAMSASFKQAFTRDRALEQRIAELLHFGARQLQTEMLGTAGVRRDDGRLISYCGALERAIFAFSASSLMRCKASGCLRRSIPWSRLNSSSIQSIRRLSQSSPPR